MISSLKKYAFRRFKKAETEFASEFRLKGLIQKYSDHIPFPVEMQKEIEIDDESKAEDTKEDIKNDAKNRDDFLPNLCHSAIL